MKFDIITIFPHILDSYFSQSIIGRAVKEKNIQIKVHNLRDWTRDKHKTVDDTPYGGGAGMVLKIEPIFRAVQDIKLKKTPKRLKPKTRVVLLSARGRFYNQKKALAFSRLDQLILISGRYEGVDQRVGDYIAHEEISIGPYVLTGGELPAAVIADSVARLIPGVVGNKESLREESYCKTRKTEYPQYTKPEKFQGWKVPPVLLSGNHARIKKWQEKNKK
ncbi:MAG: tRNA (guanosine(37)-N1)-methyltransferase TrmD [Patescibacteria group bacterium]|nr:tRNA (guanosine(37)-N1)-methyltransferase TrmD [Patescibacteria group bacterium]